MVLGGLLFFMGFWLFILPAAYVPPHPGHIPPIFMVLGLVLNILHVLLIDRAMAIEKLDEDSGDPALNPKEAAFSSSVYLDPLYHAL